MGEEGTGGFRDILTTACRDGKFTDPAIPLPAQDYPVIEKTIISLEMIRRIIRPM